MVLLKSTELPLNQKMPAFTLNSPFDEAYTTESLLGKKGLIIIFTCNHCPYALAIWPRLISLNSFANEHGINMVAINPNIHPNYPDDAPDKMKEKISEWNIPFPYLIDDTQNVARQYNAQCTPDIYMINNEHDLVYHGRLDDNWQNPDQVSSHDLQNAIQELSQGLAISSEQFPAMGCSIKWR